MYKFRLNLYASIKEICSMPKYKPIDLMANNKIARNDLNL